MDQLDKCQQDIQTAFKMDPTNQELKSLLMRVTASKEHSETTKQGNNDPQVARFQEILHKLDTVDVNSVKSLVSSNDFISILTSCGSLDTSPRVKSLAFMILAKLFNPPSEAASKYPLTFIIEKCAACFSYSVGQGKNESKLLAYRTLQAIFQTSMTVGSAILCQEGTVEEMMDTVEFEIVPVQIAIAEVLNIACSDKSCRKQIL
ncbi:hypothetical protein CU097_001491, partial [Rhizopus azygosporus]